jgi:hypothetical protein
MDPQEPCRFTENYIAIVHNVLIKYWKSSHVDDGGGGGGDDDDMAGILGHAILRTIFISIVSLLYSFFRFTNAKSCKYY